MSGSSERPSLEGDTTNRKLEELQRHWDRFGRDDPYWAILTDPEKQDGRWSPEDFFAHGVREIEQVLRQARERGCAPHRGRALDFGCAVGRLTQALCAHFEEVDGVDVAPSMLDLARHLNRYGERCRYHLNTSADLRRFEDACFDLVYSVLVLQHMPPALARGYIREFLRVLKPGGLLVFQLPSAAAGDPGGPAAATIAREGPLPPGALRALILPEAVPESVHAGDRFAVKVALQNRGEAAWPANAHPERRGNVVLGNHWLRPDGTLILLDDARAPLVRDLAPGDDVDLVIEPHAPDTPGDYLLELDVVQEGVTWFGQRGSPTAGFAVRVVPRGAEEEAPVRPSRPDAEPAAKGTPGAFRERNPRGYEWLRRLGVVAAYRGLRRGRTQTADWRPVMEMHCIPKPEVLSLLAELGGKVVDVARHAHPGFRSYHYWVVRRD